MLRNRVAPVEVIPSWAALGNQGGQVRTIGNTILFSATDLMRFVGCAHATALDLAYMRGEPLTPREDTEDERCRMRSEEHTSELQSLMRISYAVFCLKKKQEKYYARCTHVTEQDTTRHTD